MLARCRRELAGYKVPRVVHVVEAMPQTATGKLSRKQLREMLAAGDDSLRMLGAAQPAGGGR
jgi:long-chain acyl-CoA synthetase